MPSSGQIYPSYSRGSVSRGNEKVIIIEEQSKSFVVSHIKIKMKHTVSFMWFMCVSETYHSLHDIGFGAAVHSKVEIRVGGTLE